MKRCQGNRARLVAASLFAALAGTALSTFSLSAAAQGIVRSVPADVKLAKMTVTQPPVILLNGVPDRLSPGSRIHDVNNMLALSGGLANVEIPVVYKRDAAGLVHEVWMLTAAEYAKLGGVNTGTDTGAARFAELLALIFGARP